MLNILKLNLTTLALFAIQTTTPAIQMPGDVCDKAMQIAYVSDSNDKSDIYLSNIDGTIVNRLTNDVGNNRQVAWSPDGSQIAFASNREGSWQVYVMNNDGSEARNLSNNNANEYNPAWSPNASSVVYVSDEDGDREIYLYNFELDKYINLTNNSSDDYLPKWSPDGNLIAFISDSDVEMGIAIINVNSNVISFLQGVQEVNDFDWSPDGQQIVLGSQMNGYRELYKVKIDENGLQKLTNNTFDDLEPRWSPDGSQILFWSVRDSNIDLYRINASGDGEVNLTNSEGNDSGGVWSPDGSYIAFQSDRLNDGRDLWIMTADGRKMQKIADNIFAFSHVWKPCAT